MCSELVVVGTGRTLNEVLHCTEKGKMLLSTSYVIDTPNS